ncbi:hypothetical protein [Roseinatronobacter thiooxidans]|uniref:hypothetical protein n=1 Tax=Roseinatronobacter thiooxidans TaxID=121821 RepID=UPI001C431F51|nr:hypothetical protein [Roseinatronobacter thiooxidans]
MYCLVSAPALHASEHRITPEMITLALTQQGYEIMSETRTLLRRVRFVAYRGLIWREIVLDMSTGQIIRDYAVEFSPTSPPAPRQDEMPRGGTMLPDPYLPHLSN